MREKEIERLTGVVSDCVSKHMCSSTIFFVDEIVATISDSTEDHRKSMERG